MKKILFVTNIASPYRVDFFDTLGKRADVTVVFYEQKEDQLSRSADWFVSGQGNFKAVQLKPIAKIGEEYFCPDVVKWLNRSYDAIIICGYSSPTTMLAMAYLRMKRIPFYIEVDGGLIREESKAKYRFKKMLVSSATYWLSSGPYVTDYLVHYGAKRERVYCYPFTSLWEKDILQEVVPPEKKAALRRMLGISEEKMVISVGRFMEGKGFDVLLKAAAMLPEGTGVYIVGGEPTEEYLELQKKLGLDNVHFCGFQKKEILLQFYQAADLFALPTRSDVWGLVVNEAMACGLPVVTTDKCVAGLEMIEDGVNGYVVPVDDVEAMGQRMNEVLSADLGKMGAAALEAARKYTIENMAEAHVKILEGRG